MKNLMQFLFSPLITSFLLAITLAWFTFWQHIKAGDWFEAIFWTIIAFTGGFISALAIQIYWQFKRPK